METKAFVSLQKWNSVFDGHELSWPIGVNYSILKSYVWMNIAVRYDQILIHDILQKV